MDDGSCIVVLKCLCSALNHMEKSSRLLTVGRWWSTAGILHTAAINHRTAYEHHKQGCHV